MKKVFGTVILLFVLAVFTESFSTKSNVECKTELLRKKRIDVTITSTGGCSVHIVGDVEYSLIPPSIDGFSGSVTISGPKGCPNGSMTFAKTSSTLNMTFNNQDVRQVTQVTWGGTQTTYSSVLNDANVNSSIVAFLNALN